MKRQLVLLLIVSQLLISGRSTNSSTQPIGEDNNFDPTGRLEFYKPDSTGKPWVRLIPPFIWYQSLNHIEIEIKFAYRQGVSGCATLFNETIKVTSKRFYVSASCETADNILFFELDFPFWAKVNSTTLKVEKRPVGKIGLTIGKATNPARWRQLYKEGEERPQTMKLDLTKQESYHYSLSEFEDDEILDFEGHDLLDKKAEKDPDDLTWLFPAKGPGEFKKLKKKKKKANT